MRGTITRKRRPDGKPYGSYIVVHDAPRAEDGRRRQVSKSFGTKREAEAYLASATKAVHDGSYVAESKITTAQYLRDWIKTKAEAERRATTLRSYQGHLDQYLIPALGAVPLKALRHTHVQRMVSDILAGNASRPRPVGPATMRRIMATLNSAMNAAVKARLIRHNPAQFVELAAGERPAVTVWAPEQVGQFLDAIQGERLAAYFHLVAYAGLRRGEGLGLRWADLDLDNSRMYVRQQVVQVGQSVQFGPPKTKKGERQVPLDAGTVAVLRAHERDLRAIRKDVGLGYNRLGLVFTTEAGDVITPQVVTKTFRRLAVRAGLPVIRLHDLRHSCAALHLQAGTPMKVVSELLGHSSITITMDTYTHVSPAVATAAVNNAAALIPRATAAVG